MSSDLSQESEAFIQQQVSVGIFRDRIDALEAGVDLLRRRQALLDRLAESRRQLDEGEFFEYDDEGLTQLFEGLQQRASRRTKVDIAN